MHQTRWLALDRMTTRIVVRTLIVAATAMPLAAGRAQKGVGDGFLFHRPTGTLGIRAGYSLANASSDVFALQKQQLTIGSRGFDALSLGLDLGFDLTNRVDLGLSVDGTIRSHDSEYREFEDNSHQPIKQTTSLNTVGLSLNLKYNFRDRGRAIGRFAWIPSQYVPYVGVGGGVLNYDFHQKGDFIDMSTTTMPVFSDELDSQKWTTMGQLFTGVAYNLGARTLLTTEARYTHASAKMNKDYSDFGRIDLSGLSLSFGTSFRF